ncbi:MAG TPA: hypothetical protein PKC59_15185, partial [Burkholderiaceae bacterium]|nr:hypothetical protein [Burkholderiaceae bacterium]
AGQGGEVSVSVGVVSVLLPGPGRGARGGSTGGPGLGSLGGWANVTPGDIVGAADQALYEAKHQGRARCCSVTLTQTAGERFGDRPGEPMVDRSAERTAARAGDA